MAEFFNKNVKYLRSIKGISQQVLADKVGLDRTTISRIENGEIETTIDNAINISNVLGIDCQDMICRDLSKYDNGFLNNDLEILFSKAKDKLDPSQQEIIKFVMNDAIKKYEDEKNGNLKD